MRDQELARLEISAVPGGGYLLCVDDELGDEESDVQRRGRVGQLRVQELHPWGKFSRRGSLFEKKRVVLCFVSSEGTECVQLFS